MQRPTTYTPPPITHDPQRAAARELAAIARQVPAGSIIVDDRPISFTLPDGVTPADIGVGAKMEVRSHD